ncbi:hypothetical protein V500_03251 [Pseudogymnoascus sp. VKM F-4518 (FW-2643)]|nr:hypothetical protein V500_03251 [Pseudogymnoascus sp. VKM F-4518 (FW-2643)]
MTTYDLKDSELEALKGKTLLITGASTGIGRDTVKLAHKYGAHIAIGDWNAVEGQKLADELGDRVLFHETDVSNFSDVIALFKAAHAKFGIINAVLSNHGIANENFLADEFDATGTLLPPNMKTIDVNLTGTVYVAKLAAYYFLTAMLPDEIRKRWGSLPANETWSVGRAILLPVVRPDVNGKSLFVGGHHIVDFEDKLHETQPLWMGEQMSKDMDAGQLIMIP